MARIFGRRSYGRAYGLGSYLSDYLYRLCAGGLNSPQAKRLFWIIAVSSVVFLAVPGIQYLLLFSGIGIPLLPAVYIFPPIALFWALVLLFRRVLPISGQPGLVAACIATMLLLFLPAQWLNSAAKIRDAQMVAGDHNSVTAPLQAETVGLVTRGFGSGEVCGTLCLHLLLSGSASTVITHRAAVGQAMPDPKQIATAHSFEKRSVCPEVKLDPRKYRLPAQNRFVTEQAVPEPRWNAAVIASQRIASGTCLVSQTVPLSQAKLIIASGPVLKEGSSWRDDGFLFGLAGAEVSRLNIYQHAGSGKWQEVFRETSGKTKRFFSVLLPIASMNLDEPSGWLRQDHLYNDKDYSSHHNWSIFGTLSGPLRIALTLDDRHYRTAAQGSIMAMLAQNQPPTKAELQAFEAYWFSLGPVSPRPSTVAPDARDAEIAMRLAQSLHVPLPWNFYRFVEFGLKTGILSEPPLAKGLATRLRQEQGKKPIKAAARAMAQLSEDTLLGQLGLLDELSRSADKRPHLESLLHYLYLDGLKTAPILVQLIETGRRLGDVNTAVQGLAGLCKLGPAAAPFMVNLRGSANSLSGGDQKTYFRAHIRVAAQLGIPFETLRQSLPGSVQRKHDGNWLVQQYKTGQGGRWSCQV